MTHHINLVGNRSFWFQAVQFWKEAIFGRCTGAEARRFLKNYNSAVAELKST